jgi:signal transduction histidine kinase
MDNCGNIDISLANIVTENENCSSCKSTFTGNYSCITVKDSGSGIPQHLLTKIGSSWNRVGEFHVF